MSIQAMWVLLQTLGPVFLRAESLPSVDDVDRGRYGPMSDYDLDCLKNDITILRQDFRLNNVKQQSVQVDRFDKDAPSLEFVDMSLRALLEELERLVDPQILMLETRESTLKPQPLPRLARLAALRELLRSQDRLSSGGPTPLISSQTSSGPCPEPASNDQVSPTAVTIAASFIRFPEDIAGIESCRRAVVRFGIALDDSLEGTGTPLVLDPTMPEYTSKDKEVIQHAHDFASASASLFSQMVDGTNCGTPHQAKLHLCGFKQDRLKMRITCQETRWVSAVFTLSREQPSPEPLCLDHICSPPPSMPAEDRQVLYAAFNTESMWASHSGVVGSDSPTFAGAEQSLDHLLSHRNGLSLRHRKLAAVLLMAFLFQLSGNPSIEPRLDSECIFVPWPVDGQQHQQWCPRVLCTLVPRPGPRHLSDDIAALGVLLLELETNCKAEWTPDDEDWGSGGRSDLVRLARVSEAWKDSISDGYRRIASACLEFDSLLSNLDLHDIVPEMRTLAVIYKHILEPLCDLVLQSFGNLAPVLEDMLGPKSGLTAAMRISPSATAKRAFFDDDDSVAKPKDVSAAEDFFQELRPFLDKIKAVRGDAARLAACAAHNRVKIAVLDSGVDDTDSSIRPAIKFKRINAHKSTSFVGHPDDWQKDTYGHGTHVTRLLLTAAPAAEIYVGKICSSKHINDEFMSGIAKAIGWAVDEVNADIISISFGFDDENDLIDAALDKAVLAGKLVIAAASNNGGLSGRARPARREDVICMHATDGKGNKGGMNPSPMPNRDNFATLGVAVPSRWKGEDVWKSGTSFAVPIAVGFAADILELARHRCTNLKPRKLRILHRALGMRAVFQKMAERRDGYDFIHPVRLGRDWHGERAERRLSKVIEDVMEDL